jgi:uncharacterized protein YndB with AHSA1/START domain
MTSVRPEPIELSVETPASVEAAWEALTDPERVAEWFTDASPVGRPGDPYRLDFGDSAVEGSILELEPGRGFAHSWRWEGDEDDGRTTVRWTIEPMSGGGSLVTLRHEGWPATTSDDTTRDDHLGYWLAYLEDLDALLSG